ncbi:MAG: SdrD B-like domain-containing protein [Ornithinibacter sp.]
MPSTRRVDRSSPPRRLQRARGGADVLACSVWALVVWGACLAATAVVDGPGGRPGLVAALTLLPGAVAASWAAHARRQDADAGATGALYRALAAAAAILAVGGPVRFATAGTAEGAVTASLVHLPLHAVVAMVVLVLATGRGVRLSRLRRSPRRAVTVVVAAVLGASVIGAAAPSATAATGPAPDAPTTCAAGQEHRSYAVAAATVDVPFNRWGATLKSARIFVLEQDLMATKNWSRPLAASAELDPANNRRLRPRPLVLRANEGECVKVTLTNRLSASAAHGQSSSPRVGIQAAGVVVDARRAGGAKVGFDDDPTVGIGGSITYYWRVPAQEGLFLFQDMAAPAGGEHDAGSRGIGLYGGLAVEPAGSVWTDPRSGAVLSGTAGVPTSAYQAARNQSGELYVEADIHPPGVPSFRESVQLAQDEIPGIGMGFNYGSEPMSAREGKACPDCLGEETWLSSWPYGDPALVKLASGAGPWLPPTDGSHKESEDCGLAESCYVSNVLHTYAGDATKIRFGLAGVKETHVFHLHAHQWLADPRGDAMTGEGPDAKPESTTIDSQSFGPGEAFSAELLYGAGSRNGTFGDSIFHCHLYPHFAEGFWSLMRVHDVLLDGTTATPDGVGVRPLIPLPGRPRPPVPTADNPGYPGMIPGTFGWRAPQPRDSITQGGVDGTPVRPAPRLVAGRSIDAAKLAVEDAVIRRRNGGGAAKPGAPFSNPCPTGAREVDYAVTVLQRDLVYNEAGHHDPQARVMVLTKDVADILAGRKKVEPLFIRVNAGDCINFALTNMAPNWTGGDAFQQLTQTNMAGGHVHLVKFDVTASDGGSNGWNYQQAAFTKDQAELTGQQASGAVTCKAGAGFYGDASTGCRIPERDSWTPPKDSSGLWGQTIHERWYADYELRTAFTHDHHFAALVQNHGQYGALIVEPKGFDMRDPRTGDYQQPINDASHGTPCGSQCAGDADGEAVDLVGPGANDDYREFGLAIADFVPLVKRGGDPTVAKDLVNGPESPEHYPSNDPGTYAVNYRNAPLVQRGSVDGTPVDPAFRFSSWVHGDPMTPLLEGYARDNVKLRVIQGSQEEQHLFQVHGLRWREEPDDPGSPLVSAQTIGISEAFNIETPGFDCSATDTPCRGDYLYGGTSMDDLWNGMWGIMRMHGRPTADLLALPDNPVTGTPLPPSAPRSRLVPPHTTQTGNVCPTTAPERRYDVVAMTRDVVYNEHGDHDPQGLMYVLAEDEDAVRTGAKKPEPLVLRANAGDCVRVTLRNSLTAAYGRNVNGVDGDPGLVLEPILGTPMGTRVSLHPQLLRQDPRLSDGAAVGFNADSTAAPGKTVSYEWFADTELGAANLLDYGDVRGHRQHGLAAALVVEPKDSTYHDPSTGAELRSGTTADIRVPGQEDFREATLVYQDGLNLRTTTGAQVPDHEVPDIGPNGELIFEPEPDGGDVQAGGTEDAGEKGVNYTNAPLHRRLGAAPGVLKEGASSAAWGSVFSSATHGDPATPTTRAYAGDQLRMRVLGANRPRQMGFQLDGASWRQEPYDTESPLVGVQGGIGTGKAVNAHVRLASTGDHLWSSPTTGSLPQGIWGLARVYPRPTAGADFVPSARPSPDSPFTAGASPLQPLERSSLTVRTFTDSDGDGTRDAGEPASAGTEIRLLSTAGARLLTTLTRADGTGAFSPPPGTYDVEVVPPTGTALVGDARRRVDLTADGARADVSVAIAPSGALRATVFEDSDADGVRDAGEGVASGWSVTLTGSSTVPPVTTGATGTADFSGLRAGSWAVSVAPRSGWRTTTGEVQATVGAARAEVAIGVSRRPGFTVRPVDDTDGNGVAGSGERTIGGLVVEAAPEGAATILSRTDDEGTTVDPGSRASKVRVLRPDTGMPWQCTKASVVTAAGSASVACDADGWFSVPADALEVVAVGPFPDGVVTTRLFDDADRDGTQDPGEAPLADWPVALVTADTRTEVMRTTSDSTGVAGLVAAPGSYEVVPMPPTADVPWVSTKGAYAVKVARAGQVAVSGGWVQPGSVSVGVFHDLDQDGIREAGEVPLADRSVSLLDGATGAVVATQLSDGTGRAAFPAKAGTTYRVSVELPTGWRATSPLSNGTVQSSPSVTAPADGGQGTVEVGHYNTVDRTPPAAPTLGIASGALTAVTLVPITAETGATIRYTLDGTAPTASRGMLYSTPVRVSRDRVLRAVAVDAAGNSSALAVASYTLPWTGKPTDLTPTSWSVTSGGAPRGGTVDTASDDGRYLSVASAPVAARPTVDVTATMTVPVELRSAVSVSVSTSLRSTMRGTRLRAQYWDASTSTWRAVETTTEGLDESKVDVDLGAVTKLVDADGKLRIRYIADQGRAFDLAVDRVAVTLVNRR